MYYATKKFLTSKAFHPCITLVVQTDWKLAKKSVEVKKSAQNGTFCLPPSFGELSGPNLQREIVFEVT